MEWNGWSEGNPPSHHVILPFTRLLGGPMDYTPGTFDILLEKSKSSPKHKKWHGLDKGNSRVNTTLAKQLANWVILYSPVQMASDLIDNYDGHPAFQFFRDFDADCDWSKALDGILRHIANAYRLIYQGNFSVQDAVQKIVDQVPMSEEIENIVNLSLIHI